MKPLVANPPDLLRLGNTPLLVVLPFEGWLQPSSGKLHNPLRRMLRGFVGHPKHQLWVVAASSVQEVRTVCALPHLSVVGLAGREGLAAPVCAREYLPYLRSLYPKHRLVVVGTLHNPTLLQQAQALGAITFALNQLHLSAHYHLEPAEMLLLLQVWAKLEV